MNRTKIVGLIKKKKNCWLTELKAWTFLLLQPSKLETPKLYQTLNFQAFESSKSKKERNLNSEKLLFPPSLLLLLRHTIFLFFFVFALGVDRAIQTSPFRRDILYIIALPDPLIRIIKSLSPRGNLISDWLNQRSPNHVALKGTLVRLSNKSNRE